MKFTVKKLKDILNNYSDDAEINVVITNGTYDSVYTPQSYDFSVEGEDEIVDEYTYIRERNPESKIVSIVLYR